MNTQAQITTDEDQKADFRVLMRPELAAPFSLFLLLILFESMDVNAFGPVMAQIRDEFQLSATELGLYAGLGSLFGILTAIPIGEFIRGKGYKLSGTLLAVVIVVGSLISFFAPFFLVLLLGRVIVTIGARGCQLVGQAGGTTVAPATVRSTAWALMNAVLSIGGALGAVLLGGYVGGTYGWRAVMLVTAGISSIVAIVYALFLRMPAAALVEHEVEAAAAEKSSVNVYKIRSIYVLGAGFALTLSGLIVNSTFSAVVAQDRWNLGPQFAGNTLGLGLFIALPFLFLSGILADWLKGRKLVVALCILLAATGTFIQVASLGMDVAAGGANLFRLGLIVCYAGGMAGGALLFSCAPDLVPRGTNLGPVYAILSVVSFSGWFLEPLIAGVIRDATGSFDLVYTIFGLSPLLALFLLSSLKIR